MDPPAHDRWVTNALDHRIDPAHASDGIPTSTRVLMQVVDQRITDHDGVVWAPTEGLDAYRHHLQDELLEQPKLTAWLSVDVDDDAAIEHLVQIGSARSWEQLFVVIDHRGERWEVVVWDIVSSRYGTPTLVVMSTESGPPPFGFSRLVGGTGTGYFSSSARFYHARNGWIGPVFETTADVSLVRGTDPSHQLQLRTRVDYSARHGFQATYDVRIQWPDQRFEYDGSLVVWSAWNEAAQRYVPDPDLDEDAARKLRVIEDAFEVEEASIRAAFSDR